jgi:hypothetical protein
VPNVFGVPLKETVRTKVLEKNPKFNFNKPEARIKGLGSAATQLYKQKVAMGSFVENLHVQINRVEEIMQDITNRLGARGIDKPRRELLKSVVGSGNEAIIEAYMAEVSREIGKLASGSSQSIRALSDEEAAKWDKIHDPSLSFKELMKILKETQHMASIRKESVDKEIAKTMELLDNVNEDNPSSDSPDLSEMSDEEILAELNK